MQRGALGGKGVGGRGGRGEQQLGGQEGGGEAAQLQAARKGLDKLQHLQQLGQARCSGELEASREAGGPTRATPPGRRLVTLAARRQCDAQRQHFLGGGGVGVDGAGVGRAAGS